MKTCLIVNPHSGPVAFKKQLRKAQDHLLKKGCELRRFDTTAKGDGTRLARQAALDGFEVVVAVGGDGTLNEVCNGLVGTDVALGVLPAGTGNVFAADVGIPIWTTLSSDAVLKAAEIIVSGRRHRVDLGHVRLEDGTTRHFLMWCGIGLDAAITQSKSASPVPRPLNYATWVISGVIVASDFMGTPATLEIDQGEMRERILMAVASNGQLYGRVWRLAPEAKMDDGLLDVAVMAGHRWPSTIKHVFGLTFKKNVGDPDFNIYRTRHLSLTSKLPLPVHVDAEFIGKTPLEIDIVPKALTVILPQDVPARLLEN
jgi:YegS/Rv2252/BmrU family lipid kinase